MSQPMLLQGTRLSSGREPQNTNRTWKTIRFLIARRSFESQLQRILRAAYAHEANGMPPGDPDYEVLNDEANCICSEFAIRWNLDVDLLKAHIPGLAKLDALASVPAERDYVGIARAAAIAVPIAFFLMGCAAGLFSFGFHLMGGR